MVPVAFVTCYRAVSAVSGASGSCQRPVLFGPSNRDAIVRGSVSGAVDLVWTHKHRVYCGVMACFAVWVVARQTAAEMAPLGHCKLGTVVYL